MSVIRLSGNNKELYHFVPLQLAEFIPVVHFDKLKLKSDLIATIVEGTEVELSEKIDISKRKIKLFSIVTAPGTITLPFKTESGSTSIDADGVLYVKIEPAVKNVSLKPGMPLKAKIGECFELEVTVDGNESRKCCLDFYADDDSNDIVEIQNTNLLCGRIEILVFKDVFGESEIKELLDEMNFIQPFADAHSPAEYAGNYCMSAAERGLSKLLGNTIDFYAVDRMHNKINAVDFNGKNANDRGANFKAKGFVESNFDFEKYQINSAVVSATKNETDFYTNAYLAVTLNKGSDLYAYFVNSIKEKPGFHVYYLSITDAFHTLILLIDNRIPGNEVYAIYDQHGKTSSYGALADIEDGFARQTSWTFLNFYIARGFKCGVVTKIWKIQRI